MKLLVYIFYNGLYLALSAWFLLYANVYLNSGILPNSLRWKDGNIREDLTFWGIGLLVILIIEVTILIALNNKLNKWYTSSVMNSEDNNIVWWSTGIILIALTIWIGFINSSAYS
ncbi:MAG: hypothetical protein RIC95_09525 [Vicingaceae bacterium]